MATQQSNDSTMKGNNEQGNNTDSNNSKADNQEKIKLRQLATKAKAFFDNEKYDNCITVLKSIVDSLIEKGERGLKVSHNIALCEYHQRVSNKQGSAHFFLQELACTALLQKSHHNWWQILLVLSGETVFLCTRACPTQRLIAMCTLVGHGKHTAPSSPPAKPRKGTVVAFPMALTQ